jgi:pyruvate kinase
MNFTKTKIDKMISQLDAIIESAKKLEEQYADDLSEIHPKNKKSALNLLQYLALRHHDISDLQNNLGKLGVSRLGKAESHVMHSILLVKNILRSFNKYRKLPVSNLPVLIEEGDKIIRTNTTALLGQKLKGSKVRIMVTQPSEAADDKKLVYKMLSAGMNSARVNCAHDDTVAWEKMIDNINKARKKTGRNCKVCMDLGGPKLRTGMMKPGPKVIHLQPTRDELGRVISPAKAWLGPDDSAPKEDMIHIPVEKGFLKKIKKDDVIRFKDTRGKKCVLKVEDKLNNGRLVTCKESAYIVSSTKLTMDKKKKKEQVSTKIETLQPLDQKIILKPGDTLILHKDAKPGETTIYDAHGKVKKYAHISCTLSQVFKDVQPGESLLLDDGKIEGRIVKVSKKEIEVEVVQAKEEGTKLKADKGINLPESKLSISGLTEKDIEDLKFVAQHADVVNLSFVNTSQDVYDLINELKNLNTPNLGIIYKIETQSGFKNLPGILLTAMQSYPLGVMIARGDLAIEGGWQNLAGMQEEIMRLCEAAHVPIIWATQVLETLSKKGIPSRAEITDAAAAQQAECVMLNKGPHVVHTIKLLDTIMKSQEAYHKKKAPMLPKLQSEDFLNFN